MSNLTPSNPGQPLSVGDVVSAGVRIYRSHLKRYLTMSLIAYLWILVPIYGWAKYAEISARISRITFQELINQPESNSEAEAKTSPQLWNFFVAGLLVGLIFFGLYIGFAIVFGIFAVLSAVLGANAPVLGIIGALFTVVFFIVAIVTFIRMYSRLLLVEVPIAIENVDATTGISRSWNLTKGSVGRVQLVVVVAFLISLLVNIPSQIVAMVLPTENVEPAIALISALLILVVSIVSGALIMPFWQVIKAVMYYDLRARREGLGLQLRDQ